MINYPVLQEKKARLQYFTKLACNTMSSPEWSFQEKVEAFHLAINYWPEGSYEREQIIRDHPELAVICKAIQK